MLYRHLLQGLRSHRNLRDHHPRRDENGAHETPEAQSFACSPIGIKRCEHRFHAKQKGGVRGADQTLHMGLDHKSEEGCKKDADDQGPCDLRVPNKNRVITPSGHDRAEHCHRTQLEGGEPVDITGRCEPPGQDNMPGNAHSAQGSEKISLIDFPGSVRAQEKKADRGRRDSPLDILGDGLSKEKGSNARNKDHAQSGQKTGIRSGRIVQGHRLKGIRSEEEDTEKDAPLQNLRSDRAFLNKTKEKKEKRGNEKPLRKEDENVDLFDGLLNEGESHPPEEGSDEQE